jgi:hypothetical protein
VRREEEGGREKEEGEGRKGEGGLTGERRREMEV